MTRHNYLQSPLARLIGREGFLSWDHRVRIPAAGIAVALCLVAAGWLVEQRRLAALDERLAVVRHQARAAENAVGAAQQLRGEIVALEHQADAVARGRLNSFTMTNRIAAIGNALPAGTWLTTVQTERGGSWMITGRATALPEVGDFLQAVAVLDRPEPVVLIGISAARTAGLFEFSLRIGAAR